MLRTSLDRLYTFAAAIAALAIVAICLLVTAQVSLNILARIGGPDWSYTIPSYADFAGYFLATASFMAMAYTLRSGTHIRVNLLVQRLPEHSRWILEIGTLVIGAAVSSYATYFTAALVQESWHYGDKSTGIIAISLWIPQLTMVAGLALLTLAFVDTLLESLRAKSPILTDTGSE
ncbi:TRAP transporter small permease [Falsihalocynthiibacter sp. S25ZX9]|uniref:TRAP transporter small permease n=1 Tax=Falsihalocynthiibacter sp. S25ZX9 TaxID=3240870 RepID=UPI00350FE9FE